MGYWRKDYNSAHSTQNGWKCRVCETVNWPKHKCCWTCKAVRTYAEVAAAPAPSIAPAKGASTKVPSPGQTLHQQLSSITKQLGSVVSQSGDVVMTQTPTQTPMQVETPDSPQQTGDERQALTSQIGQLENSLAALPPGPEYQCIRDQISTQIAQTKAKICSTRPLGARLDGCRDALERAKHRLTSAESLAQAAIAAQTEAASQVTKLQSELAELENLVAEDTRKKEEGSSLDRLQTQMQAIVGEMSNSIHVDASEAQVAMQQMTQLFQQLSSIAVKSQKAAIAPQTQVMPHGCEAQRLQQMLLQNAIVMPVDPPTSFVPPFQPAELPAQASGECLPQVIAGGG